LQGFVQVGTSHPLPGLQPGHPGQFGAHWNGRRPSCPCGALSWPGGGIALCRRCRNPWRWLRV